MNYNELKIDLDNAKDEYTYMDIYKKLWESIERKTYLPGTKLPTESELSSQFNVKRFTVRKAIQKLIADGWVFAIRNKGYYARFDKISVRIRRECSYTQRMIDEKLIPRVKLLEIKTVRPNSEHKNLFNLNDEDILWEIYVLRYYKGVPFLIGKSYLPFNRVPDFNLHYMQSMSIHKVLQETYDIKVTRKSSVCRMSIADKKEARLLSVFDNSPLLKVTNINNDQENKPIEHSISTFRADIVQISINL